MITERTYNWDLDFLFDREIQVRVGEDYSRVYTAKKGTSRGSVRSPLLFNIIINDIFFQVEQNVGKSLYALLKMLWATAEASKSC